MSPRSSAPASRSSRITLLVRRAGAVVGIAALACDGGGSGGEPPAESSAAAAPAPAAAGVVGDSTCPNLTGRWDECNVKQRLERAGLAPRRASGEVRQPIFHVPGVSYAVGRAELQVFLYPDSAALAKDLADVDTARVQGRGAPAIPWPSRPTLMTSNNLAAVLLSDDATQVERVQLAMTAGLPAPTKKK